MSQSGRTDLDPTALYRHSSASRAQYGVLALSCDLALVPGPGRRPSSAHMEARLSLDRASLGA